MRTWLILAGLAVCGAYMSASIVGWWEQPIAAFFGRREFWWDAEDFAVFYAAGTLVARGDLADLYSANAHAGIQMPLLVGHDEPLGFYNPAFFALLFVPFSWLPAEDAYRAWTGVNLLLVVLVCALMWRIAAPLDTVWRVVIIVAFLTMYPLPFGLRLGQFSLILAASWAGAYVLIREGRDRAAGFALAPMLVKPELLIPVTLFLAWKRQWDVLRTLLPVAAIAIAVSIAMIGPVGAWDYTLHIADAAGEGAGNMYGWNGILAPIFAPGDPGSMMPYALPLALMSLAGAAFLWRGTISVTSSAFPLQWLALTLATVLWDAHIYMQDLIIVAPAAVAVLATATEWRRTLTGAAIFVGWFIIGYGSTPSAQWGFNLFSAYVAACLAAIVAWEVGAAIRTRTTTTASIDAAPSIAFERRAA